MLIVHNRTGLILGVLGVFIAMVTIAVTGLVGLGGLMLAAIWFGGGIWWKYRQRPDGVPGTYPSVYFIPLPFLAVPVALLAVVALLFESREGAGDARRARQQAWVADRQQAENGGARGTVADRPRTRPAAARPATDADPVDHALNDLRSGGPANEMSALMELARMEPQAGRRAEVLAAVRPVIDQPKQKFNAAHAITALAHWGTAEEALPVLIEHSRGGERVVRSAAIKALGRYRAPEAVRTAAYWLVEDPMVASDAAHALQEHGAAAEPYLLPLLATTTDHMAFMRVCNVLGEIGGDASLEALQSYSESEDISVKLSADTAAQRLASRLRRTATGGF